MATDTQKASNKQSKISQHGHLAQRGSPWCCITVDVILDEAVPPMNPVPCCDFCHVMCMEKYSTHTAVGRKRSS